MSIKIITDSSCDLNKDIIKKYDIKVIPLPVSFEDNTYLDGELSIEEFYSKMKTQKTLPKTACSSPEVFRQTYEECEEDEIIVITITSNLSGVYSTATLGKNLFEEDNKNKKIYVLDSESGCVSQGILVYLAGKMTKEGKSFDEIINTLEKVKKEIVSFGTLETLEKDIKGGRDNKVAGKIVNALNLKVIIKVGDHEVKPVDKARGDNKALSKVSDKILENIDKSKKDKILFVAHANNKEKANKLISNLTKECEFSEIVISEIGSVMGVYTAEGAVIASVY